MINFASWKIGDIVAADFRKAEVLKQFNIDFCCGGKTLLKDACKSLSLDQNKVLEALCEINEKDILPSQNYSYWDLSFLCDYIYSTHHNYVQQAKKYLLDYASKVEMNHAERHPDLVKVREVVFLLFNDLETHMKKEEIFLFPSIKKLAAIYKNTESDWTQIQSIRELTQPIKQMEAEHDEAGIYIKQLIDLTNNFTVPENACLTFSVFYVE